MAYNAEYQRQYRIKNRERLAAYKKCWDELNKEKIQEDSKKRYLAKKDQIKAYVSQYKKLNSAKANANKAKRKAAKKLRTPIWLTPIDFERIENEYKLAAILTKIWGEPWHVDHIIPLQGKLVSVLQTIHRMRCPSNTF